MTAEEQALLDLREIRKRLLDASVLLDSTVSRMERLERALEAWAEQTTGHPLTRGQ